MDPKLQTQECEILGWVLFSLFVCFGFFLLLFLMNKLFFFLILSLDSSAKVELMIEDSFKLGKQNLLTCFSRLVSKKAQHVSL